MATRNIVPRADGEGQVGLAAQAWGKVYADEIYAGGSRISDDKKVKASSTDASPGYLDAKVDGTSIEISGDKLSVKQTFLATTSAAGLVELATDAEFDTGSDTGRVASVAQIRRMRTGWKNLIINGNFDVWQRGTSFTGASIYTADMWRLEDAGGASVSVEKKQEFVNGAYVNVARVTRINAILGNFKTVIDEWRHLSGKTLTLSFWARGIGSGFTTATSIMAEYGSGGSTLNTLLNADTAITTDWQKYTYTFTVPDLSEKTFGYDNKMCIYLFRDSASNTIEISQVQLELGGCATPFERRPYWLEKALCLEYFERWKPTGGFDLFGIGAAPSATQAFIPVFFSRKRTAPTITIGGSAMNVYGVGWVKQQATSVTVNTITPISALFAANVESGLVAGNAVVIGTNDDKTTYIDFSAELY